MGKEESSKRRRWSSERGSPMPEIEPIWPGVKIGLEWAVLGKGPPRRWLGVAMLDGPSLRAWAAGVLGMFDAQRASFPRTLSDVGSLGALPLGVETETAPPPRQSTLAEGQALCAAMWALDPLYRLFDIECAERAAGAGTESGARNASLPTDGAQGSSGAPPPSQTMQRPGSPPGNEDEGSGDFFRAGFCSICVDPQRAEMELARSRCAFASMLGAFERMGVLAPHSWSILEEVMAVDWLPRPYARVHAATCLDGFITPWGRLALDVSTDEARPDAPSGAPPRL